MKYPHRMLYINQGCALLRNELRMSLKFKFEFNLKAVNKKKNRFKFEI